MISFPDLFSTLVPPSKRIEIQNDRQEFTLQPHLYLCPLWDNRERLEKASFPSNR